MIRYMGSKRILAPSIAAAIRRRHPDATVLDAFAGMCAIATELAPYHRIIANDAHAFAEIVARALLTAPAVLPSASVVREELWAHFRRNYRTLESFLRKRLCAEHTALARAASRSGWRILQQFTAAELEGEVPRSVDVLPSVADYTNQPSRFPYALFSLYFASTYVGVRQALEIDSLRYAIDRAPQKYRNYYLLALLHATSHCAATPGHFAQYLIPRDEKNTKYIARIRRRSVLKRFMAALRDLVLPDCRFRRQNKVHRGDAADLLASLPLSSSAKGKLVIYADPPYSKAQYSRYYHVLETLVLYDYPELTGKGRYRGGRFQTDFSRKAKVTEAIDTFVSRAAGTGAPLYLSYPRNGLLFQAGGDLLATMRMHYPRARIAITMPLSHSTMGGAPGTAAINVTEDVYYGSWH